MISNSNASGIIHLGRVQILSEREKSVLIKFGARTEFLPLSQIDLEERETVQGRIFATAWVTGFIARQKSIDEVAR